MSMRPAAYQIFGQGIDDDLAQIELLKFFMLNLILLLARLELMGRNTLQLTRDIFV
jgi:hypothetical protein